MGVVSYSNCRSPFVVMSCVCTVPFRPGEISSTCGSFQARVQERSTSTVRELTHKTCSIKLLRGKNGYY